MGGLLGWCQVRRGVFAALRRRPWDQEKRTPADEPPQQRGRPKGKSYRGTDGLSASESFLVQLPWKWTHEAWIIRSERRWLFQISVSFFPPNLSQSTLLHQHTHWSNQSRGRLPKQWYIHSWCDQTSFYGLRMQLKGHGDVFPHPNQSPVRFVIWKYFYDILM